MLPGRASWILKLRKQDCQGMAIALRAPDGTVLGKQLLPINLIRDEE